MASFFLVWEGWILPARAQLPEIYGPPPEVLPTPDSRSKAPTPSKEKTPEPNPEEPILVSADRMIHLTQKNLVKAEGHVVVRYGSRTIRARQMIVNTETGRGAAKGNVIMTAEKGTRLVADKAHFNLKSQLGKLFNVKGKVGGRGTEFHVSGKKVERLGENHYQMEEASLTTCTGSLPDWIIEVDKADMIVEDRALFTGGVFKIRGVPIIYVPIGYVPLVTERKSGFLTPSFWVSNLDGVALGTSYFWAINQWSDTTIGIDYLSRRGVRGSLEYRYTPNKKTRGQFNGVILDDRSTGHTFWKLDGTHQQELPNGYYLNAKLDQTSKANFNKTFRNQTENRTRRSSDSFASIFKSWDNNSLDILARFRESEEDGRDDTFGLLPSATFKTQPIELGNSKVYFEQETNYTNFLVDLDSNPAVDNKETLQRIDFHPQLSLPIQFAPWLQFTTKVGFRETFYNKQIDQDTTTNITNIHGGFSRELFELSSILEGPKFNRIFEMGPGGAKFKHVVEPRIQYDYIPDIDSNDAQKVHVIDAVDSFTETNKVTYFLTQRLLRKDGNGPQANEAVQVARFEISQSYDFLEATRFETPTSPRRPFSDIRFDFDSRLTEYFMLNFDTTYNFYDGVVQTFNIDVGIKPTDWLMLIVEKRNRHNESASILGTVDVSFAEGWNAKYSARFDEFREKFLEHNARLTYNEPCQCWGFSVDFIHRQTITGDIRTTETKVLFSIELRGLGELDSTRGESFIHRSF